MTSRVPSAALALCVSGCNFAVLTTPDLIEVRLEPIVGEDVGPCDTEHPCPSGCCADGSCTAGDDPCGCGNDGYACTVCRGACTEKGECACVSADDCPPSENPCTPHVACVDGACRADANGFDGECAPALGCLTAALCNDGECVPRQDSGSCGVSTSCLEQRCDEVTGECIVTPRNEGGACTDGVACTYEDFCYNGACIGAQLSCSGDLDACNFRVCNGTSSCGASPKPDGGPCDDGDVATFDDVCAAGVCNGTPVVCPADGNCFTWAKNGSSTCVQVANGATSCNNGDLCTYADHCSGVSCVGTAISCDAEGTCFTQACNGTSTCAIVPTNEGLGCNDGDACSTNDVCTSGVCAGSAYSCGSNPCAQCDGSGGCQVNGCVDGSTNTCLPGDNDTYCGNSGNYCYSCYSPYYMCWSGDCALCPSSPEESGSSPWRLSTRRPLSTTFPSLSRANGG